MNDAAQARKVIILGVSGLNSVGGALAAMLSSEGWDVAITCRPSKVPKVSDVFTPLGVSEVLPVDALDPESIDAAFEALSARWGHLDALVHCFVACPSEVLSAPLTELGVDAFSSVMQVGVYSLIRACKSARGLFAGSSSPRVVSLLSESYRMMTPNYHVLGIMKGALRSAISYLAYELGAGGVLVNGVSASLIATDGAQRTIGARATAATREHLSRKTPTRHPTTLDDVSHAVRHLSSPCCGNVTGQVLVVDGGYSQLYF